MIMITKKILPYKMKRFDLNTKQMVYYQYGFIPFPLYFGGKKVKVMFDKLIVEDTPIGKKLTARIMKSGHTGSLMFPRAYIGHSCSIIFKGKDVKNYFIDSYDEAVECEKVMLKNI